MSVNSTVARTRSAFGLGRTPVRNSSIVVERLIGVRADPGGMVAALELDEAAALDLLGEPATGTDVHGAVMAPDA